MTDVKISIIVPIYNMGSYLCECLDTIINQSLKEIEIICINDGSTDNSLDILQNYARHEKRIIVIDQKNKGVGASRNIGINISKGKYIMFMDPDDYYPSNVTLEKMFTIIENNKMNVAGGSWVINNKGKMETENNQKMHYTGIMKYSDYQNDFGFQRYIFLRQFLLENRILFPEYIHYQDPPFLVKALCISDKFYSIEDAVYCYRTGHKKRTWELDKSCDLIRGNIDVLNLSSEYKLERLHKKVIDHFNSNYSRQIASGIKDEYLSPKIIELLILMEKSIDTSLLKKNVSNPSNYQINMLHELHYAPDKDLIKNNNEKILKTKNEYIRKLEKKNCLLEHDIWKATKNVVCSVIRKIKR